MPRLWPTSRRGASTNILLVDDGSTDNTVAVAREMGLTVIAHPENRGYGGNQKTCYKYALDHGADVVVMIHPDYQYDARVIPHAVGLIELGICDVQLRFADKVRPPFTAVIFAKNEKHFTAKGITPATAYAGREVRVRGKITSYRGPEVILDDPAQIEILK